jgi:cathepsin X
MMKEIKQYGPISCGISVTDELKNYTSGSILNDKSGNKKFNHYVTVYGWGVSNTTKYWNVMNSWGPTWGE